MSRPFRNARVAVLLGGLSAEREISLQSGAAVLKALRGLGYRATAVPVGRDLAARLARLRPDVAFNALHGRYGEDGAVQGLLEMLAIPYTGPETKTLSFASVAAGIGRGSRTAKRYIIFFPPSKKFFRFRQAARVKNIMQSQLSFLLSFLANFPAPISTRT